MKIFRLWVYEWRRCCVKFFMNEVNRYNIRVKLAPSPSGGGQQPTRSSVLSVKNPSTNKRTIFLPATNVAIKSLHMGGQHVWRCGSVMWHKWSAWSAFWHKLSALWHIIFHSIGCTTFLSFISQFFYAVDYWVEINATGLAFFTTGYFLLFSPFLIRVHSRFEFKVGDVSGIW